MCRSTTWALLLTTVYSIIDQWLKKNQIGKWKWWAQFHKGFQPALFHYYLSLYSTNVAFSDNRFCNLWKIGLFQSHRFSTLRTKMHLFDWMWWHFFFYFRSRSILICPSKKPSHWEEDSQHCHIRPFHDSFIETDAIGCEAQINRKVPPNERGHFGNSEPGSHVEDKHRSGGRTPFNITRFPGVY